MKYFLRNSRLPNIAYNKLIVQRGEKLFRSLPAIKLISALELRSCVCCYKINTGALLFIWLRTFSYFQIFNCSERIKLSEFACIVCRILGDYICLLNSQRQWNNVQNICGALLNYLWQGKPKLLTKRNIIHLFCAELTNSHFFLDSTIRGCMNNWNL